MNKVTKFDKKMLIRHSRLQSRWPQKLNISNHRKKIEARRSFGLVWSNCKKSVFFLCEFYLCQIYKLFIFNSIRKFNKNKDIHDPLHIIYIEIYLLPRFNFDVELNVNFIHTLLKIPMYVYHGVFLFFFLIIFDAFLLS